MAVYVDPIRVSARKGYFQRKKTCRMYADDLQELQEAANLIGLDIQWYQNRGMWFQGKQGIPHFDLTEEKRISAIKAGAIEHTEQQAWEFRKYKFHYPDDWPEAREKLEYEARQKLKHPKKVGPLS